MVEDLVKVAIWKMNKQMEKLIQATEKRVTRFMKLAEKADTEEKRHRYIATAIRAANLTEASLARSRKNIERLEATAKNAKAKKAKKKR
jgi:hypothetical protein